MRILFLTLKTFSATGGIEKFNRCFCKALRENAQEGEWQVEVLSAYDGLPDENYFPGAAFKGFGGNRWRYFAAAIGSMRRADLVVFGHINLGPLMRLCQLLFPGKKTICMAHGREVWESLTRLQYTAIKACTAVWAVSRFTAGILSGQKGVSPQKIQLFYNTLDPFFAAETAHPATLQLLKKRYGIDSEKLILTVARLSDTEQLKGYDSVLAALPAVLAQFPNTKYLLCGKWDEAEKKRITNLINALKLHNVVILTGFIENSELTAHYKIADLFVLPSQKEGFGIVFLEAAWCGLPVIGGNRDGSSEALLDGRLGILVDPGEPLQIAAAIALSLSRRVLPQQKDHQRQLVNDYFGFPSFKRRQLVMLQAVVSGE